MRPNWRQPVRPLMRSNWRPYGAQPRPPPWWHSGPRPVKSPVSPANWTPRWPHALAPRWNPFASAGYRLIARRYVFGSLLFRQSIALIVLGLLVILVQGLWFLGAPLEDRTGHVVIGFWTGAAFLFAGAAGLIAVFWLTEPQLIVALVFGALVWLLSLGVVIVTAYTALRTAVILNYLINVLFAVMASIGLILCTALLTASAILLQLKRAPPPPYWTKHLSPPQLRAPGRGHAYGPHGSRAHPFRPQPFRPNPIHRRFR